MAATASPAPEPEPEASPAPEVPPPVPDEPGPHDVPDEQVIEKTLPPGPPPDRNGG